MRYSKSVVRLCSCLAFAGLLPLGCASGSGGDDPSRTYFDGGALQDPEPMTIVLTGRVLKSQGRVTESEYVLRRVIAEYPAFSPGYLELSELLVKDGRTTEAARILSQGIAERPDDAMLHNDLGICMIVGGDLPSAETAFTEASRLDPDEATYISNLAMVHALQGEYDVAVDLYLLVMPVVDAHSNVAQLAEAQGDIDRARRDMEIVQNSGG
jgi:Flp pilus assembly protein TadD